MLELIAGVKEEQLNAEHRARKELLEEAGMRIERDLERIMTIYPSPGGTSERIALYLGYVALTSDSTHIGGGAAEGEDPQLVILLRSEALAMIQCGEITDAKTIIALQYLALQTYAKTTEDQPTQTGTP